MWCRTRLLRIPYTARRSNQSVLKEINAEYSLEGLMLKLTLQYFGFLMQRANSLEKPLMLRKIEGGRRRGWQRRDDWMASSTQWTRVWANSGRQWRTGKPRMLQSMGSQRIGHDWETEQQQQIVNILYERMTTKQLNLSVFNLTAASVINSILNFWAYLNTLCLSIWNFRS